MPKCDFNKFALNFVEIALRRGCSPANLLHIFRTPFYKNISGGLLLQIFVFKLRNSKGTNTFKGYLRYKTILCYKVALDVQLMNFFI